MLPPGGHEGELLPKSSSPDGIENTAGLYTHQMERQDTFLCMQKRFIDILHNEIC